MVRSQSLQRNEQRPSRLRPATLDGAESLCYMDSNYITMAVLGGMGLSVLRYIPGASAPSIRLQRREVSTLSFVSSLVRATENKLQV